jgi:opacity protein-like surface antigen
MKKLLLIIAVMATSMAVTAQITDINLGKNLKLDRFYAGYLAEASFQTDTAINVPSGSFSIGAMATWRLSKVFSVGTLGVYQSDDPKKSAAHLWIQANPNEKVRIVAGFTGTVATEQKPKKVTGDDHFITFTEDKIPGSAYNVKVVADSLGKKKRIGFGACVAYRGGLEYQAMFRYHHVKISGWYDSQRKFGSALTLDFARVYNVTTWKQDQVIANFIGIKLGKGFQVISDNGFDFKSHKLVRSESGFLKTFESPTILHKFTIKGLIGLTWKNETKSINAYLFVHF